MKYLILLGLLVTVSGQGREVTKMTCKKLNVKIGYFTLNIVRCENNEVICYRSYETGLQCKFKKEKK